MTYPELHAASAFSFLEGASLPEDLVEQAASLGLPAVALVDRNTLSGAPRFFKAAKAAGVRPLVGAEVVLEKSYQLSALSSQRETVSDRKLSAVNEKLPGPLGIVPDPPPPGTPLPRLTLLVENQSGYRNLCRILTEAARHHPKGKARASWDQIQAHSDGLHCMTGGIEGLIAQRLIHNGVNAAKQTLQYLHHLFPNRLAVEIQRHGLREEEHRNRALIDLSRSLKLPLIAAGGVRYATRQTKDLADILACIREGVTLDTAGRLLDAQRERHLKAPEEMQRLFTDVPLAIGGASDLADRLTFTLDDLGYRFPDYPLPAGESINSYLRQVTWAGARCRFRPLTARAQKQLAKELDLIEKLDLGGYFLIVWDIVRFCQREKILAQGRGSAANSAVCYALSITAVDPVRMELLFERFLSEERGEWPDIDLDLPSGAQREKVIQYVYSRYGPDGAAMTANVITYRDRSASREVGKAVGFSIDQVGRISKRLGGHASREFEDGARTFDTELRELGLDPDAQRVRHFKRLWHEIHHLPRHLGQHSGGMVIAQGRLDEIVPLEPAAMEGRTIIQWDKDDCADLGLIKVDLLGLGMLAALEDSIPMIRSHEGIDLDLAHLPPDDPETYAMIRRADTAGVFQIESRAQMASLPRNRPECFYDLVVQVAIIRPGPIAGKMTSPYLQRRLGREAVSYPHPSLEPVLKRTLGVPLFQEQLLRIAMVAAGFSGGEAEELRRAMGFKRSHERMKGIEARLRRGMTEKGITGKAQEQVVRAITSFALYGFPESHAASFALIVYASAYLKCHHPTAFYAGLLNAWPLGFYHPATLVKDAQRAGVEVHPVDVNRSGWRCRWENGGIRLGFRWVHGLRRETGERIEYCQAEGAFSDPTDLARRCRLSSDHLERLAHVGALGSFGLSRRKALWQVAEVAARNTPLFERLAPENDSPLADMTDLETTMADYSGLHLTTGPHLVSYMRPELDRRGVTAMARLRSCRNGQPVKVAGAVIVRQRPGTAKGFVFLTMEDDSGTVQAIIKPDLYREHRQLIVTSPLLLIEGPLQIQDGTISVKAQRFEKLQGEAFLKSHDFH